MRSEIARIYWFLVLVAVFFTLQGLATAQTSQPVTGAATEQVAASTPGLADLILKLADLSERLIDLEESLEEAFDPATAESKFSKLEERLKDLSSRVEELQIAKMTSYEQLIQLKTALRTERASLKRNLEPITAKLRRVAALRREWSQEKKQWAQWQASLDEDMQLVVVQSTFARAQENISTAREAISRHLEPLLAAEQRGVELQTRTYSLVAEVDDLISDRREIVSSGASPPMFASRYFAQFDSELRYELRQGIRSVTWPDRKFFQRQGWVILLQVLVTIAIAFWILRYRQTLEESERLRSFAKRPFALGLTVSLIITSVLYTSVPSTLNLILSFIAWVAIARLAAPFITRSSNMWFIYGVVLTAITIQLLRVFGLPLPLFRLYVFAVAVAGLSVCLWLARQGSRRGDSLLYIWGLRLGSVVFMVVAFAEVSGYPDFPVELLKSSLRTFGFGLAVWMFMLLARGGVDWAVHNSPLQRISVFRNHGSGIAAKSAVLINLLIGSIFVAGILTSWRVYDRPIEAFTGVLSLGFTLGSQRITVGLILAAAALLYGSFLASSAVQALLLEEVFPRRKVAPGIGLSMSRLIHYCFVLVGFLLAVTALGFTLTNLTILGGALGVGIGFGLQAIVNNFASGIILLFERPIKVGDIIQLAELPCQVKKIGLRATVVQSRDDAEIVVPNSDLITSQVTNWTLSQTRMRLRIPVGVAYGSDVPVVMQILKECAEENALVRKNPAPKVLFLTFGESSLDFELRVWVNDFIDRRQAQSELNQEIDRRFRSAKIEIPFPKIDLHVRGVEESPGSILTPLEDKRADLTVVSSEEKDEEDEKGQ